MPCGARGQRRGPCGGGPAGDAVWIAHGHAIRASSLRRRLAAFDGLPGREVLSAVESARRNVGEYEDSIGRGHLGSVEAFNRYTTAQERKNWDEADRLFLDELARDRTKYRRFLDAEEVLSAFSTWLCRRALDSDHVYRWIDPLEIGSCTGGTFESRIEKDGTRRGFKALSANPRLRFGERKIRMRVPVNAAMCKAIQCVQYTVLPRPILEKDERIDDPKSAKHDAESEVRVPDGTPIPIGTDFEVLPGSRISEVAVEELRARYKVVGPGGQQDASA